MNADTTNPRQPFRSPYVNLTYELPDGQIVTRKVLPHRIIWASRQVQTTLIEPNDPEPPQWYLQAMVLERDVEYDIPMTHIIGWGNIEDDR